MAKFKRFDPQNKKAARKSGGRSHHLETKHFRMQKLQETDQILHDDIADYLEDHPL